MGMFSESMAKQFGDFIRTFVEYDKKVVTAWLKNYMRIQVEVDFRQPLKRKKKKENYSCEEKRIFTMFKYEKFTTFYFICGRLGHGEIFCPIRIVKGSKELSFGWDLSLKAPRGGLFSMGAFGLESLEDFGVVIRDFQEIIVPNLICIIMLLIFCANLVVIWE